MNRVEVLQAALAERRAERGTAERKLAEHEILLERASAELSASNGSFDIWQEIDQRVRFETRQVERYRGIVEQCKDNVSCAESALASAEREARIAELVAQRSARRESVTVLAREAIGLVERLSAAFRKLDELKTADSPDLAELRKYGQFPTPLEPADVLLLELMGAHPNSIATAYICNHGYRSSQYELGKAKGLLATLGDLFTVEASNATMVAQFRASLGDSSMLDSMPKPAPKVEPPAQTAPIQAEDFRVCSSQGYIGNHAYCIEEWTCRPDARTEYRLNLPQSFLTNTRELSRRAVDLPHGLKADLVTFEGGTTALMQHRPSIVSRVTDSARLLASKASDLLGLDDASASEEQPTL